MSEEKIQEKKIQEENSDNQMIVQFARSHAWALVKRTLIARVMALDSVSATLENEKRKRKSIDDIKNTLYANGKAVTIIVDWINQVETLGGILEADFANELREKKQEQIIVQLPD